MPAFLAVLTPEADSVIGHVRARWDPSVARGLGAHITIRYPFLSLRALGPRDLDALALAVASVPSFRYALTHVSSFPTTVFLEPEPMAPFAALRTAVDRAFGSRLPVDAFPHYAPHLSVARNVQRSREEVIAAVDGALASGVMNATCSEVVMLEREGGPWRVRLRMPLGA